MTEPTHRGLVRSVSKGFFHFALHQQLNEVICQSGLHTITAPTCMRRHHNQPHIHPHVTCVDTNMVPISVLQIDRRTRDINECGRCGQHSTARIACGRTDGRTHTHNDATAHHMREAERSVQTSNTNTTNQPTATDRVVLPLF